MLSVNSHPFVSLPNPLSPSLPASILLPFTFLPPSLPPLLSVPPLLASLLLPQVGTSSVVYPAAGFAPMLADRGVPVAEFNLEDTPVTGELK